MWNDITHSWDTFLPRNAAWDFIFCFLNCVISKIAKPDQKLYADAMWLLLLSLPLLSLLNTTGPCPQCIGTGSRVGHVALASTNHSSPIYCIFRGEYDPIKTNETQGEIDQEL